MSDEIMTVFELAQVWADAFETEECPNGDMVVRMNLETPYSNRLRDLVLALGDGLSPDDITCEFVAEALGFISACEDEATVFASLIDIEPDYVTADLLRWLGSSLERIARVDQAAETNGFTDLISAIQAGQCAERREVAERVYRELRVAREGMRSQASSA